MNLALREDPALETLFRPLFLGNLTWPADGALFLRARDGAVLHERPWPGLVCEQSFKPDADALRRARFQVMATAEEAMQRQYGLVLVLPPRQRAEARALLARAVRATARGGRVVLAATNVEGARSLEDDLTQLAGRVTTLTKNKCRVCWTEPLQAPVGGALVDAWWELDAIRPIGDSGFVSRPGLFAWDRIDLASQLLAEHLPDTLTGRAADLGAGFGYLSAQLLERCPGIESLDVYEAEQRALELARRNLQRFEAQTKLQYLWHDVTAGLQARYDVIVTNPPFHAGGRESRPQIGQQFIAAAAAALNAEGRLWLVANKQLPYEAVLETGFGEVRQVVHKHGFKILEAIKTRGSDKSGRAHARAART